MSPAAATLPARMVASTPETAPEEMRASLALSFSSSTVALDFAIITVVRPASRSAFHALYVSSAPPSCMPRVAVGRQAAVVQRQSAAA